MTLLSLLLTLRPLRPAAEVPHLGRAAHALLLEAVRQADAGLAEAIHAGSGLRPFTASDLLRRGRDRGATPERTYALRLTALTGPVAQAVLAAAQEGILAPGRKVTLAEVGFSIAEVGLPRSGEGPHSPIADSQSQIENPNSKLQNPKSAIENPKSKIQNSPWSGLTTYEALSGPWLLGRARPADRLELEFASPTTFKSGGKHVPVPLPGLVFGGLLERWNAFAPVALPAETRRFAEECLALSAYDLRTRAVGLKEGGLRVGAVGRARYTALNRDRYWLSLINLLADFALFAGAGAGTSMGLGQCRRIL